MNKDLYGNKIPLPEDVSNYLQQCFEAATGADETTEGYKRNKELREKGEISYQQLKRIKNWFDSFNGGQNELPFILNGGDYVKNWVNQSLDSMRSGVELPKQSKSEVLPNQYIKPHEKDGITDMNRPSKSHSSYLEQNNLNVTESIKRINQLIKKII